MKQADQIDQSLNVMDVAVLGTNIAHIGTAALIFIMITMGLTLVPADFRRVKDKPLATIIGLAAQLLLLPAIAFALVALFNPPLPVAAGLVILSCCPGGATSNFFSFLAKGDVALSVTLTAISGLVVVFTLPLFVNLGFKLFTGEGQDIYLPVVPSMIRIFVLIVLPVGVGMLLRRKWPGFAVRIEPFATKLSFALILFTMVVLLVYVWPHMTEIISLSWQVTVALNVIMILLGYGLAKGFRLTEAASRSIAIETGVQNYLLSVVIAISILGRSDFVMVPIMYLFTMYVTVFSFIAYCGSKTANETMESAG